MATHLWGLAEVELGTEDPLSGGASLADLDSDGDLDLVVSNGGAQVLLWHDHQFGTPRDLGVDDAVSTTIGDVDLDGWPDILMARGGDQDRIVWGGDWLQDRSPVGYKTTDLDGGNPSAILLAVELDNDARPELIRLGRGGRTGTADVIWQANADSETFTSTKLPNSVRFSLAAAIADVDRDGLIDLWVTRDVGWERGGDSLYSRLGEPDGEWNDISAEFGTRLEIDGMGVVLADLDGDRDLDAYVSDIGQNEILEATRDGYTEMTGTGAGRIRPPGEPNETVSSSWASGAVDINLDGRLDLAVVGGGFPNNTVRNKIPGTTIIDAEPPALLLGIGEGRFVDGWSETGLDLAVTGRALALGDVDSDGDTDAVIVTHNGRVEALRNDSTAPSLTVDVNSQCGAGVEITIESAFGSFTSVVPQLSYGGVHARQLAVGVGPGPVTVSATRGPTLIDERTISATGDRSRIEIDCD